MDWQRVVKQNDQNGSTSTEDSFTQGFSVCQEVKVSSLENLYSWGCVLKCTLVKIQDSLFHSSLLILNLVQLLLIMFIFHYFPSDFEEGYFPFRLIFMKKIRSSPKLLQMVHS